MKPETPEDILELMNGSILSAVVGTAMELGIFWLLADQPLSAQELSQFLNVPLNRCHYLLQILCHLGLVEENSARYAPSAVTWKAILNVHSQATWAFQAREDRDIARYVRDLALNIRKPMSDWQSSNLTPTGYFQQIEKDSTYTERFTRKLYQIHLAFAEQLAYMINVQGANRLLDLGGGSGVVSFALLRKYFELTAVVLDVENVCKVGREIALENKLQDRISYIAADFLNDQLPTGFDIVMLCDVGVFNQTLFQRIHGVLNQKGRLVIVDKFAPSKTSVPPSRLLSAFLNSLEAPSETVDYITTDIVQTQLQEAGFRDISTTDVPHQDRLPWNMDWVMLEAHKEIGAFGWPSLPAG